MFCLSTKPPVPTELSWRHLLLLYVQRGGFGPRTIMLCDQVGRADTPDMHAWLFGCALRRLYKWATPW